MYNRTYVTGTTDTTYTISTASTSYDRAPQWVVTVPHRSPIIGVGSKVRVTCKESEHFGLKGVVAKITHHEKRRVFFVKFGEEGMENIKFMFRRFELERIDSQ